MSPRYKLTYFDFRGLAELSRILFAYAGVDYEFVCIEKGAQWDELKPKTPFGVLPTFEVDGVVICQSQAIARYIARQYGIAGKTPLDSAKCDMLVDGAYDLYSHLRIWYFEQDPEKKAELLSEFLRTKGVEYLNGINKYLQSNDYFVGDSLTWADVTIATMLQRFSKLSATILDNYPSLVRFRDRVLGIPSIKEYLDKREAEDKK